MNVNKSAEYESTDLRHSDRTFLQVRYDRGMDSIECSETSDMCAIRNTSSICLLIGHRVWSLINLSFLRSFFRELEYGEGGEIHSSWSVLLDWWTGGFFFGLLELDWLSNFGSPLSICSFGLDMLGCPLGKSATVHLLAAHELYITSG